MHARKTTTKVSPNGIDKAKEVIEGHVIPAAKQLAGFRGGYWLIDRATGEGIALTFFDTGENLKAGGEKAKQIRGDAMRELQGEMISVEEFEVAADTGQKVHSGASHVRVLEFAGDNSRVDETIGLLRERVLPAAKELPGFVGGLWLVNRDNGKGVGVTLFDSGANLAASREGANAIRERSKGQMPGDVGEFKEYEVLSRAETPAVAGVS